MTLNQLDQVAVAASEAHWFWIKQANRDCSDRRMVDVAMPPIGWRTLANSIPEHAFGPLGGRKQKTESLGAGFRRINKALAILESHPAFRGIGLVGRHFEMFLAWGESPYPTAAVRPSLLLPRWSQPGGLAITDWSRSYLKRDPMEPLFKPSAHWAFKPPRASPASEPSRPRPGSTPAGTTASPPP